MLRTGSSGEQVTKLQKRLTASGFDAGEADGIFGGKTEAALRAFQESAGIAADGVCGPQTLAKLAEAQAAAMEKLAGLGKKADDGPAPL